MILPLDIIITFSSLIYGLALAHSLSCIAQYIQNKNEIKQYWVWWVWAIIILLLSIGFWVSTYISWKDANIPMKGFVAIVTQSSIFYLSCYLFFNHISEMTKKDLEYEYFKYKRITFILLLIQYFIIFVVYEVIQDNLSIKDIINNILNLPLPMYILNPFSFLILLAFINNKKFHSIFSVLILSAAIIQFLFN